VRFRCGGEEVIRPFVNIFMKFFNFCVVFVFALWDFCAFVIGFDL